MSEMHRAWAEVNLDAIAHNLKEIKKLGNTKILAVVKADAYGHGYLEVTRTLLENGADYLGVAMLDEAVQLRKRGIDAPILILGGSDILNADKLVEYDIMPTVYNKAMAKAMSLEAVRQGKCAKIHIKIDTGMNRIGLLAASEKSLDEIEEISNLPNIQIEGIFTHFACADEKDTSYTKMQYERFCSFCKELEERGVKIPIRHACNSAGVIMYPDMYLDMVRPGIILYGHYPSKEVDRERLSLMPAMTLKARVTHIKEVGAMERVSYGGVYETKAPTKIATIPIGYADGFSRILSGNAKMIAGDKKVSVIGKICMDQCMIDVTNVQTINVGDEVILFGTKNEQSISVEELADEMGTINYEVLCVIGKRIPRVYIQGGKVVEVLNYLA